MTNKVRQLLNKVTQRTLDQIFQELLTYDFNSNEDNLKQVAKLFLEKCINEPEYCALYTKVIKSFFQGIRGAKIKFLILLKAQHIVGSSTKDEQQRRPKRILLGFFVFLANLNLSELLDDRPSCDTPGTSGQEEERHVPSLRPSIKEEARSEAPAVAGQQA